MTMHTLLHTPRTDLPFDKRVYSGVRRPLPAARLRERFWSSRSFTRWRAAAHAGANSNAACTCSWGQLGEVGHDLVGGHARGEVVEDVVDGDPGTDEAWLPTPYPRPHVDHRLEGHDTSVPPASRPRDLPLVDQLTQNGPVGPVRTGSMIGSVLGSAAVEVYGCQAY